ncbi:MAG: DUF2804 domain-containing protein [Christensenellales bacterium]|jgi:hypothetical protein
MQTRITQPGPVLDERGRPHPGWSDRSVLTYRRGDIKAPFHRIKEWDYYQISDENMCLELTFGHASYAGQVGAMLFNFRTGERYRAPDKLLALPFGRLHLPESAQADSDLIYDKGGLYMRFRVEGGRRQLTCRGDGFEAEIHLTPTTDKNLVINVPFDESPTAFYYNQKINCLRAEGAVRYPGGRHIFGPNAWGILDWGRGCWPFHNEWYWSNGAGEIEGQALGFNLGMGFGNTSAATENILFYGGESHKLGAVRFELDQGNYLKPWRLTDDDGRLELTLYPSFDRTTRTKLLWVDNGCHQVFGEFTGYVVLDDGRRLDVSRLYSFAEHAVNNW